MPRKPKLPADSEFNPYRPPLSACWWMQRFIDHFVAEMTAKIEQDDRARTGLDCVFVGSLTHACRLTDAQSDGLLAVLNGRTPAEWAKAAAAGARLLEEDERRREAEGKAPRDGDAGS